MYGKLLLFILLSLYDYADEKSFISMISLVSSELFKRR